MSTSSSEPTATRCIGTPLTTKATKAMMLGSGELGKEVVIELMRLGVEVIACDRYADAPAMQVAHRSHVFSMLDKDALRKCVELEQPDFIIPEIEAIATEELVKLENEGYRVVPTARAAKLTMDREGIRTLATDIKLQTSPYRFAATEAQFKAAVSEIGCPCVVKPCMSSSGKGQSVIKTDTEEAVNSAWKYGQEGGRAGAGRMIVEGFVDFEYEITLLTVRHRGGTSFCSPIGHMQIDGDYRESWQPQQMTPLALERAQDMAQKITEALGGWGLFGVEFFVSKDEVWFSEVSPRPHDTGMVTMISQDMPQFAIHARAILGLPVTTIRQHGPSASAAILAEGKSESMQFSGVADALTEDDTSLRIFGKPSVDGKRRVAVGLARGTDIATARAKACKVRDTIVITDSTDESAVKNVDSLSEAAPADPLDAAFEAQHEQAAAAEPNSELNFRVVGVAAAALAVTAALYLRGRK